MATYPVEFHRRLEQKWESRIEQILSVTGTVPPPRRPNGSVALSADGNIAILGGFADDGGVALVFTRSGGHWTQDKNLVGTGAVGKSAPSVALSADGSIVMIGGSNDNGGIGAAWMFTRSAGAGGRDAMPPDARPRRFWYAMRSAPPVAHLRGPLGARHTGNEGVVVGGVRRNWPSVPVPSTTTNTRFGAAARHCVVGRGIKCCPCLGRSLSGHLGPARTAGPFSVRAGPGGVFFVVSHWKCTMNSIIRLR